MGLVPAGPWSRSPTATPGQLEVWGVRSCPLACDLRGSGRHTASLFWRRLLGSYSAVCGQVSFPAAGLVCDPFLSFFRRQKECVRFLSLF